MLVEKEIIGPATHWYRDETTGLPRKLVVTPELTRYWAEQGNKMLGFGLTVPVPCEHDFDAHPMTPADKLRNNAGWVKEYRLGTPNPDGTRKNDNKLFGVLDIQDEDLAKRLPRTIRWTSPWINSFTDGQGRNWRNVISHLALTTRPRVVDQQPFSSVAAALSIAADTPTPPLLQGEQAGSAEVAPKGFCLSRAGRLFTGKKTKRLRPRYPLAFSMWAGGVKLAEDDLPFLRKKRGKPDSKGEGGEGGGLDDEEGGEDFGGDLPDDELDVGNTDTIDLPPYGSPAGDVKMEELLCDLLNALGVQMPDNVGEAEFKRALYEATMAKIKELTGKAQGEVGKPEETPEKPPTPSPSPASGVSNPLIQQEQQPMYMSLEEINKLPEPMKGVALAMYSENQKLRGQLDANTKVATGLRDAKLRDANAVRESRVALLSKLSPRIKADLAAMIALPSMALSLGDGGTIIDPMAQTLAMLEKGLSDMPRLLTTDASALSVQAQPKDGDAMDEDRANALADSMARMMGCPPGKKAS